MKKQTQYKVYCNVKPHPKPHELSAARLVADFLRADITFIDSVNSLKTPDLLIKNQRWEMKSPTGSGVRTVLHQFERASKQSSRMVFDARRIKINPENCTKRVSAQFYKSRIIKDLVYIAKDGQISRYKK